MGASGLADLHHRRALVLEQRIIADLCHKALNRNTEVMCKPAHLRPTSAIDLEVRGSQLWTGISRFSEETARACIEHRSLMDLC
jgi:hypothetical protein